jgi:hypothetical protein
MRRYFVCEPVLAMAIGLAANFGPGWERLARLFH